MAVKTASDFDTAMSKVAAVSGATGEEFDALREKAREMGAKTKFSASDAADAMNYMAMAGWKTQDMLDGIDYEEDMSGDLVIDEDAMGGATIEESEDLTGKIVKEEDFDGTHEEYEEYLKEEEALAKESSTSENAEEVIISGDDIMEEAADGPEDTLSSLPEFSQTDIDAIMGILKGLKFQVNGETEVLKIIKEEAAAYFAGQKSAEEVSDIIQSRVQVYLKENE
jgi:hypothetical protein